MLQVNKTLTHLDLSNNWNFDFDSGADCVHGIFKSFQQNTITSSFEAESDLCYREYCSVTHYNASYQ